MQKNDLLRKEESIIRVLEIDEDAIPHHGLTLFAIQNIIYIWQICL